MYNFTIKDRIITIGISILVILFIASILSAFINVDLDMIYFAICGSITYQCLNHIIYKYTNKGGK